VSAVAAKRILLFYRAYVREQEKAVTVAAKSRQFTAEETRKGQFLRGNRKNLAEEVVVRKILSPRRVAGVSNLYNDWGQWAGNMGKGVCRMIFACFMILKPTPEMPEQAQCFDLKTVSCDLISMQF